MAKITPKENFLRLAGGGMPAYVPYYNMQGYPDLNTYEVATMAVNPNIFNETMFLDGGYDMWGVRYAVSDCADGGFMPVPNEYLMEDVTEWERVLKFPEIPDVDWERKCAADLAAIGIDRNETALICSPGVAPFTHLINFMGFEEGLMSLCTEPDAVKDMLNAMIDFL